jgi:protein-tyrosine phosphatase
VPSFRKGLITVSDVARVLFVCHANLCRSPMAERLARRCVADRPAVRAGVEFASAGTHAWPGDPMHRYTAQVLREYGADDRDFASRPVTAELLGAADLVLTATREQRTRCARLAPAAVRRVLTLRQFGALAAHVAPASLPAGVGPAGRLAAVLDRLPAVRAAIQPGDELDQDVQDPVQRPVDDFRRCAKDVQAVVDTLVGLIAPR